MRVKQIDKVLDLFEVYAQDKTPLTLTRLAGALDVPKSSAFNLIETLVARGLLYEVGPRAGYLPTMRLFDLARAMTSGDTLIQRIHGELESLAADTGETAVLSVRDHGDAVYIDVVESTVLVRYVAKVGERRPIYTTSSGKAILTTYKPAERETTLRSLSYMPHQKATKRKAKELAADLEASIVRGWCEDRGDSTADVMDLGVPIITGERHFGLALAGPIYRMRDNHEKLVAHLIAAANRIRKVTVGSG